MDDGQKRSNAVCETFIAKQRKYNFYHYDSHRDDEEMVQCSYVSVLYVVFLWRSPRSPDWSICLITPNYCLSVTTYTWWTIQTSSCRHWLGNTPLSNCYSSSVSASVKQLLVFMSCIHCWIFTVGFNVQSSECLWLILLIIKHCAASEKTPQSPWKRLAQPLFNALSQHKI